MSHALTTVIFGLAASLCWGSGDFSGGLASRRANASSVVTAAYGVGFILLLILALIWREPFPAQSDILWGALAGLVGGIGLVAFYSALSSGKMGIIAPLSAVLTAALPVLFSLFTRGLPGPFQLGGFVLALIAIILISRPERTKGHSKDIWLALLAGCGFGCFFILTSFLAPTATFWPLAVARFTSVLLLLIVAAVGHRPVMPPRNVTLMIVLAGALDALGNAFYVLASHSGRLDVAAILSSLYPAATVLLATIFLRERVNRFQGIGILLALIAIPLISI